MSLLSSLSQYFGLRRCLMVLALLIIYGVTYGQITYGTVTGKAKPANGAVIQNLRSHRTSMSGTTGDFIMNLKKGDTLLTSYDEFKIDTLIYTGQSPLLIALRPLPTFLDEVTISERQLSPMDKMQKAQDDYKQIYRIGDDSHIFVIMPGFPFAGIAINIDALYAHFSRAGKNARKLQKAIVRDYYDDMVDSRFSKSLVTKYTGYEGKDLDNFMIDNRPTYEFIKYASTYDIIKYIKDKAGKSATPSNILVSNTKTN